MSNARFILLNTINKKREHSMVFKKQDLVKVCELTLTNSHCKKEEINAEIQCLFLYVKDLEKVMGGGD